MVEQLPCPAKSKANRLFPRAQRGLIFALLLAACCRVADAAPEATASSRTEAALLYVATNGDDRWSGRLATPNAGRTNGPFATLERAQQAARTLLQRQTPVRVQVRGGTYYLERPLRFGPADSGTAQAPMVYEAYPGEEPVLSGGRPVTDWRETAPGVWQARLPDVASGAWRFSQLYVNDRRCTRPVWPEEGYSLIEAEYCPVFGALHDGFIFRDGDLRADWHALGDVEIIPVHAWTISRLPIRSIDAQTRVVRLTGTAPNASWSALNAGRWYRAENVREALKRPGQFYLDRAVGTLTYLPRPGEIMATAKVIAPRLESVIEFGGDLRLGLYAEHLVLRCLTIAHNAWNTPTNGFRSGQSDNEVGAAITARNARFCALERCVVRQTGGYAVEFGAGCDSMRVESCELYDLGDGGVKIGTFRFPDEPDPSQWAARCTVRDTLIAHGGRFLPAGVGVLIGHAAESLVECNDIGDLYYSGISVGWRWFQGFSPAHHNTIRNNHIRDIGQGVLGDTGGIYCLGESPGTVLSGNVIHDVNRHTYGGYGIYFDAECRGIVAEGNLVYRTQDSGLHQNYARDNTVRNNIFAFGGNGQYRFSDASRSGAMLLERNIFYAGDGPLIEENYGPDQEFTFKDNLYWRVAGPRPCASRVARPSSSGARSESRGHSWPIRCSWTRPKATSRCDRAVRPWQRASVRLVPPRPAAARSSAACRACRRWTAPGRRRPARSYATCRQSRQSMTTSRASSPSRH
ncbi:MAG: right-handed parallel beta-helix repeat-containing protein, partial [Armatimonadota bacterium]